MAKLSNRIEPFKRAYRLWLLRNRGIRVDRTCLIGEDVTIRLGFSSQRCGSLELSAKSCLDKGVLIDCWQGKIKVGFNTFIGPYTIIYGQGNVSIGDNSLIAMSCKIISSNHTIPPRKNLIRSQPNSLMPVSIGNDVWLGAGVTVLGNVTIGDGCVVGAGAVVNRDLPEYSIAVGIPAKVIKYRK